MIKLGASVRRKSIERVQPKMPSMTGKRQPSSNGRTKYHEIDLPTEQLKSFQRKQLYTNANLSTEKSETINPEDQFQMNNSRFGYNHHDTHSIAELLHSKRSSTFALPEKESSNQKSSIDMTSNLRSSLEDEDADEINHDEEKEKDENYDDYVLGEKIQQSEQINHEVKIKKYKQDQMNSLNQYAPTSSSQLRMELQFVENQKKKLIKLRQDQQILEILASYQANKRMLIKQTNKKYQISKFVCNQQASNKNLEKAFSLPHLKAHKSQFKLPDPEPILENKRWRNPENLLANKVDENKDGGISLRIKQSLSYGKMGFGVKASRQICEKDIFEDELKMAEAIQAKLREKHIPFDGNKIKKGIINLRTEPQYSAIQTFPPKILPSNPIYKRFPL